MQKRKEGEGFIIYAGNEGETPATLPHCQYYLGYEKVGESFIPPYSTTAIRRAIAKHLGIQEYDHLILSELNVETGEMKTRIDYWLISHEETKAEAEPFYYSVG